MAEAPKIDPSLLRQIQTTVNCLESTDHLSFARHIKKLARLLHAPGLREISEELAKDTDLESWLEAGAAGGRLELPADQKQELGTVIKLIDKCAEDPDWALHYVAFIFCRVGTDFAPWLQNMAKQIFVPFAQEYIEYVGTAAAQGKEEVAHRHEGGSGLARTDPIDRFARDETLEELVAAIERDIAADKPQVVLDRLHTYCMKKLAYLMKQRGLDVHEKDTLNARAGRLFNPLRCERSIRPISDKIMRTTVETFELFNTVRNNESLAHDNDLVAPAEARFIFDAIVNLLRFLKSIEADHFGV